MKSSLFLLAALSAAHAAQIPFQQKQKSYIDSLSDGLEMIESGNSASYDLYELRVAHLGPLSFSGQPRRARSDGFRKVKATEAGT